MNKKARGGSRRFIQSYPVPQPTHKMGQMRQLQRRYCDRPRHEKGSRGMSRHQVYQSFNGEYTKVPIRKPFHQQVPRGFSHRITFGFLTARLTSAFSPHQIHDFTHIPFCLSPRRPLGQHWTEEACTPMGECRMRTRCRFFLLSPLTVLMVHRRGPAFVPVTLSSENGSQLRRNVLAESAAFVSQAALDRASAVPTYSATSSAPSRNLRSTQGES